MRSIWEKERESENRFIRNCFHKKIIQIKTINYTKVKIFIIKSFLYKLISFILINRKYIQLKNRILFIICKKFEI